MKILFSEHSVDYSHYNFPYVVWGLPEEGEKPSQIFARGFLPGKHDLSRYYMCRHVRVDLEKFTPSSENRRILRKGDGISFKLYSRDEFDYTMERRSFYKRYADAKFGDDVMTFDRLDSLFASPVITHLLVFTDDTDGREVGTAALYLEDNALAFYYYSFYDLEHANRNLGMLIMTNTVQFFAEQNMPYIYLGTCYHRNALYKTQFKGAEFFNGFSWSPNIKELKHLIERSNAESTTHLLESNDYLDKFFEIGFDDIAQMTTFRLT